MDILKNQEPITGKLRQKAEQILIKKLKISELASGKFDHMKLIHELELHQLELEMQNEELKLAKEKAEVAEKKYTELFDFAPSGYLTLTRAGEIVGLNTNAENLLGKERSHVIKSSFGFFVSADTRVTFNSFLQKIFKSNSKETCEIKLATVDGSVKYVLANGIMSNIEDVCLVTLIDISKLKQAEKELNIAREKAEADMLKSAFLANMSHEIRTPMNGILGFTELLKNIVLNSEEQQEYIQIIEKSGIRMLNILNDIISISKIESQQIDVFISDTNVNEQLEFIYRFFKLEADQKKLDISFKNALPANNAFIKTDREKVYAVLTNLVKNALKFTQTGSVEFGYEVKGEFLEFFVKDTGPGLPDEQKKFIFERFRQGSEAYTRKYEGAGLGLSISKAYVEMLGGKIWMENNVGRNGNSQGSSFFFTIPFLPVKEMNRVTEVPDTSTVKEKLKLKILVVEDDTFSQLLIIKMLEEYTEEVSIARTGVEAIEACRKNHDIELVLMDINMPDMGGYEATRKIREFNSEVVIIAQTASAFDADMEKSIAAGCNDFILKPTDRAALEKMVCRHFKS
jgi:PAS domain S-box-containing protein